MKPTRRTQPHRKGMPRRPNSALYAMMRGATAFGQNPKDVERQMQKQATRRKSMLARHMRR